MNTDPTPTNLIQYLESLPCRDQADAERVRRIHASIADQVDKIRSEERTELARLGAATKLTEDEATALNYLSHKYRDWKEDQEPSTEHFKYDHTQPTVPDTITKNSDLSGNA